jgi:formate/nitrite transporter FocA (FNT family)
MHRQRPSSQVRATARTVRLPKRGNALKTAHRSDDVPENEVDLMYRHAFFTGISSGVLVGIGGTVYMACDDRYVGAVLFSVALLSICLLGLYLYTGRIGYLGEHFSFEQVRCLGLGLVGNYIGATLTGLLVSLVRPTLIARAQAACLTKLSQPLPYAIGLGALCGILMYVAVKVYKEKNTLLGVLFCIPTFILAGFEHSIADMFYFALARNFGGRSFLFLLMVVIGNSLGGVLLPCLARLTQWERKRKAE